MAFDAACDDFYRAYDGKPVQKRKDGECSNQHCLLPDALLSGATIPYELFPRGLQRVADILPLTQGIRLMKAASMGAWAVGDTGRILLLFAIMVVCSLIAVKTFRWE